MTLGRIGSDYYRAGFCRALRLLGCKPVQTDRGLIFGTKDRDLEALRKRGVKV
jgi:hypothetical protein